MLEINTNNYKISYDNSTKLYKKYTNNYLITEIYRCYLYKRFKKLILKIRSEENINNLDKYDFISLVYLYDIVSIFIINHKFKSLIDPIFDSISPFIEKNIKDYFNKNCIPSLNLNLKNSILLILPKLTNKYLKYYKKIKKNIINFNDIEYIINYEINDLIVSINLEIIKNNLIKVKYKKKLDMSLHIFNHLVKLYNTKMLNNYESNDVLDIKVIEYIYMIFIRYQTLSSGNNQASILPSFKKLIKDTLNIKIELFGSPLNTSSYTFGSLFYDIDNVFGSIGNYFKTKLLKGNYEINPVFDKCLIDDIINKCLYELNNASENNNGLLFLFILPTSYEKYSNNLNILNKYKKFEIILKKKNFPYIRYNRTFLKTVVSSIVNTHLLIFHNDYINNYVKENVINFETIINNWQKKKIKNIL